MVSSMPEDKEQLWLVPVFLEILCEEHAFGLVRAVLQR